MANNTNVYVRDTLQKAGATDIGYNEEGGTVTFKVNGNPYTMGNDGFAIENDRYVSDVNTIRRNMVNGTELAGVNDTLAQNGRNVYFDPQQQKLYVNGIGFNTDNMLNVDGRLIADKSVINNILNATGFKNPYESMQNNVIDKIENYGKFSYNPNSDQSLKLAQESAMKAVREDYGSRGLLNSSDALSQGLWEAAALVPQYEQIAYSRYMDGKEGLFDMLSALMGLSDQSRSYYDSDMANTFGANGYYETIKQNNEDNRRADDMFAYQQQTDDRNFKEEQYNIDRDYNYMVEQDALDRQEREDETQWERAYQRFLDTGYVSEEDAEILGMSPGYYFVK